MTSDNAFLADICAHPNDDTPRLVYADWLEEEGNDPQRAAFIRAQLGLGGGRAAAGPLSEGQRQRMEQTERGLYARQREWWRERLRPLGIRDVVLRRGFPEVVEMEAADFLAHGGELLEHAPVRGVRLTRLVPSQVPALVAAPQLSLLTTLDLRNNGIGPEGARALAAAPQLSRLTTLELWGEGIGEEGARALASSPHLAHLIKLNLWGNGIGPEGARALAESPHLASLTALELRGNNIGARLLEQIERTVQQRRQAAQDGAAGGRWSGPTGTNPH